MDKFEKIYQWRKNRYKGYRRFPQKIRNDLAKGLHYNVDVLIATLDPKVFKMYENTSPTLSFIGMEPISYWRRSIASYQTSFDFMKEAA
jgi:hypothetical protein